MMRTYIIDGNKFSNIEGFFDEIDLIMTKGISFKTGHNLNAFDLRGGNDEDLHNRWQYIFKYRRVFR